MHTLTITGNNANDLMGQFDAIAQRLGYVRMESVRAAFNQAAVQRKQEAAEEAPPPEPEKPAAEPEVAKPLDGEILPPIEKPKRGRPKVEKPPVEVVAEPAPEPEAPPAEEKPLDHDDVRIAMKELASRVNVEAVSALLKDFGTNKASGVPVERIAEFVEKARAS
jgi:outer membrane biosynthesis protein TonB